MWVTGGNLEALFCSSRAETFFNPLCDLDPPCPGMCFCRCCFTFGRLVDDKASSNAEEHISWSWTLFFSCLQVVVPNRGLHLSNSGDHGYHICILVWTCCFHRGFQPLPKCRRVKVTKMKLDLNGRCKLYLQSSAPRRWKIRGRHGIIYGKGVGNYSKTVVNLL